jgi:hypothetical protein
VLFRFDRIEEIGEIHILDITYTRPHDRSIIEVTMTAYLTLDRMALADLAKRR